MNRNANESARRERFNLEIISLCARGYEPRGYDWELIRDQWCSMVGPGRSYRAMAVNALLCRAAMMDANLHGDSSCRGDLARCAEADTDQEEAKCDCPVVIHRQTCKAKP